MKPNVTEERGGEREKELRMRIGDTLEWPETLNDWEIHTNCTERSGRTLTSLYSFTQKGGISYEDSAVDLRSGRV